MDSLADSNSRAAPCAAMFADYVNARSAQEGTPPLTQVFVLEGGLKGWVAGGENYITFMDAYVPSYWEKALSGFKKRGSRDEEEEDVEDQQENDYGAFKRTRNEFQELPMMMIL